MPKLNKFVLGKEPEPNCFNTISVYGKRKTGKSVWVKWHLQAFRHLLPWGWTFTKTKFNSYWATFMPEKFIFPEFSAEVMQLIMDRQAQALKEYHENFDNNPDFNPRAFVNWDDYMGNEIRFEKKLHEFYFTGRHYAILAHYAAQHITQTPPAIRSNTDLVVLFASDYKDSIDHYHNDFAGRIHKDVFMQMFLEVTSVEHQFLAIDNDPKKPMDKKFYFGKAEILDADPEYILGCEEFWSESSDQLEAIIRGTMQKKLERQKQLSEYIPCEKKKEKLPKRPLTNDPKLFPDKSTFLGTDNLPEVEFQEQE